METSTKHLVFTIRFSKAFDRVWHSGLLYKLQAADVTGDVLNWFKSYLSDR